MLFNQATFIGIDPTAGKKPFSYAALDSDLRPLALGEGRLEDLLAFTAGQHQAWVAVCSPRRPNQGLMTRQDVRNSLSPLPSKGHWVDFRLSDYLLRQRSINIPQTPSRVEECANWMQMGFQLYRGLERMGYQEYPLGDGNLQSLEVYPYACFAVLLELLPFPKYTLEGRLQRQMILFEKKLKIPDPMLFFEEITRFKLLKGILPVEQLYRPGELDALVAAYTAWLCANHPDHVIGIGDQQEGQVVLPVSTLKQHYSST